jgi:4-amino-4-deoxy-L-arabinose transferase-like glycosyltransferase
VPGRGRVTLARLVTANPFPPTAPWRRDLLTLTLVFGILFFFALGRAPLGNPDEGRYAEIPREMVATGDWVTPRLDGINYFEKPPLLYWAVAAGLKVFGPSELVVRAVPALFGLGGVLLTYAAARRIYGRNAGLWAAIVLGTSALYFVHTHILLIDLVVSVLMAAMLFCFILAVREPPGRRRRWLFYGLYASAALATLAKGPIGFLVTGAVMFLWLLVFDQWGRLRPLHLPSGLLLFLALAAPWHLLVAARNPAWAHFYFIHENWERFTTTEHSRSGPWWYFIPVVLLGLFPWTGFLWSAVRGALAGGWTRRREQADAWFLVTWAGFIFLFFSKSQSKLIPYILPVFPPLAVLIGAQLARAQAREWRVGLATFRGLCGLLAVAALVAVLRPGLIRDPAAAAALRPYAYALAVILVSGAIFSRGPAGLAATAILFLAGLILAEPLIPLRGTKPLALQAARLAAPGERVYHYHEFFHDFTFYAGRTVAVVAFQGELEPANDPAAAASGRFAAEEEFRRQWAGPARVFALARKKDVKELFADPSFHKQLLGDTAEYYLFSNRP